MQLFFYCSYNLSPNGYTLVKADLTKEKLVPITRENLTLVPNLVRNIFTHGGADMVCGSDGAAQYLIIKGIKIENKEKSVDDQGRTVFINMAFCGDKSEIKKLCLYIAGNYNKYVSFIGPCVYPDCNEAGYEVNYQALKQFLSDVKNNNVVMNASNTSNILTRALCSFDEKSVFSFIVLQDSLEHFGELCRLSVRGVSPEICVSKIDFWRISQEKNAFTKLVQPVAVIPTTPQKSAEIAIPAPQPSVMESTLPVESTPTEDKLKPVTVVSVVSSMDDKPVVIPPRTQRRSTNGIDGKYLIPGYCVGALLALGIIIITFKIFF